uniref:G-protein coupled receptors family 1 profile domain-containing protein n=1 Tax=Acrobeloides nanus TaxID=290746 RepID=A0A914CB27_9BILA
MEQEDEVALYRAEMYQIMVPIFVLISSIAFLANLLVIIALRETKVRNATVVLITSLTISDMWTSSIVAWSLVYNSYLPIVKGTYVNWCFSLTLEILRTGGLITGTFHLLLIAIHHYIGIVKPHSDRSRLKQLAIICCFISWLFPSLTLFIIASSFPDQGFHNCSNVEFYHSIFFRASISSLLLIIFMIITWCYIRLCCILRAKAAKWQSRSIKRRVSRENKTLFTTVLICSSFFIGWMPATVHFTITCKTCDLLRSQQYRVLFLFSCIQLAFILAKSLLNPLIYAFRIPEVDTEIRNLFNRCLTFSRRLCGQTHEKIPETNPRRKPTPGVLEPNSLDEKGSTQRAITPIIPNRTIEEPFTGDEALERLSLV